MTIYNFAKSNKKEQENMIQTNGILLESWSENGNLTNLYYLNGFFVEVTLDPSQNEPAEITPFKRGYNMKNYSVQIMKHFQPVSNTDLLNTLAICAQ